MATLRKITLNWEIRTGAITCDTGYIKRQELCDVDLYVTVDGTAYALDTSWALNLSIKPTLLGDNAALIAVTTWTASATTGLYQATAQTMGGAALDTYLAANNSDTTDDEGNKLVDLDVYYTISTAVKSKSDTVTLILKPDVGRADDTVPATIIARNDFLVSNGTGLLVNVAAGYAANGAFVAAQASLAITNATNYIEVTAAGVASVNTTAFTAGSYPLATVVASAGAITANTDLRAWITPKPAAGGVTSITGTANEITVTGTTTPTLSLPSALTFTAKTITGGTFASPTLTTPTIGDGTEAAPSLSFTSDTDTGVYRPAANTVGIVGGGNDVVRLTGIASATDYLEVKNGIGVGSPLHVLAEGASANIGVHLQPKGSGLFTISDGTDFNKGIRFRSSSSAASAVTLIDAVSTAGRVITLPDATGTLALVSGDLGTPSALVGTNITGTASGLTAGLVTSIGDLTGDVTSSNRATTLATVNSNVGSFTNASLTVNAKGLVTAASSGAAAVTSVTGTANEITVTGTTTPTLSLPSALTFTGKTVTGGTFSAPTLFEPMAKIYKILDNQDGTRQGHLTNDFKHVYLDSGGDVFLRSTDFISSYNTLAHFSASTGQMSLGMSAFLSGKIGFKNSTSIGTTTLASANVSATDYTATLPAATGTLLLANGSGANLTALNASNVSSGTLADARNTVSNSTTTSMTALTTLGAAGVVTNMPGTTSASSATTGALTIGNGTAATNVGVGGGKINAGSTITAGGTSGTYGAFIGTAGSFAYNTANCFPTLGIGTSQYSGVYVSSSGVGLYVSNIRGVLIDTSGSSANLGERISTASNSLEIANFWMASGGTITGKTGWSGTSAGGAISMRGGGGIGANQAGGALTLGGGYSTGTGLGGSIIFQTTPAGGAGSSANAAVTALTIDSTQAATFAGTLAVTGATTLTGNLTSNGAYISTPQALSGNGAVAAVNLTTEVTTIANTGTANTTTTLAAGTNGQKKVISFITDGGFDAVITVTNPAWGGAGTITMNDALDNIELRYLNSVWQVFINNGCTLA